MLYAESDPNPTTKEMTLALLQGNEPGVVASLFGKRLEFGTAGLRGPMGLGSSCMNELVIIQTCQGIVDYLLALFGESAKERGVVIGFDHRESKHFNLSSKSFAVVSAIVFLSNQFQVYLLEDLSATPLVPFAVQRYRSIIGIMITASHNPKHDNGFKVYWNNGAQLNSPHNVNIEQAIERNLAPVNLDNFQPSNRLAYLESHRQGRKLLRDCSSTIMDQYLSAVRDSCLISNQNSSNLSICYTAMHGVGYPFVKRAFEICGFVPMVPVVEQIVPDCEFPTVKFPNPEEAGALDLAKQTALSNHCQVIIANDPDVDRLGLAEFIQETSSYRIFTGDEIGAILASYCFENRFALLQKSSTPSFTQFAMISSAVSSRFLSHFCRQNGILYHDTLTGFKHIGNKSLELRQQGVFVLFSYEEALGYCVGDLIVDKDGISSAVIMNQVANDLYSRNMTLSSYLQSIYDVYGTFQSCNHYIVCRDPRIMNDCFHRMRSSDSSQDIVDEVNDNRYKIRVGILYGWCVTVENVQDVTTGFDSASTSKLCSLPVTPSSQMIIFQLHLHPPEYEEYEQAQHVTLTIRGSGTEPKIKYYCERRLGGRESTLDLKSLTKQLIDFYLPI